MTLIEQDRPTPRLGRQLFVGSNARLVPTSGLSVMILLMLSIAAIGTALRSQDLQCS